VGELRGGSEEWIVKALIRVAFWVVVLAIVFQAVTGDPEGAKATVGDIGTALSQLVSWLADR
jgi:hypothetical protein